MAKTELQILQIDQEMRTEVGSDLADIRGRIAEFVEKKVSAEDQLKRIDIRAPQSGFVHQLTAHTVGGVVSLGEQIILVVPNLDLLNVEAKTSRRILTRFILVRSRYYASRHLVSARHRSLTTP